MEDSGGDTSLVFVVAGEPTPPAATRLDDHPDLSVTTASTPEAVLSSLADVDCVVSAQGLESGSGLDLLRDVRDRAPELPFVLFPSSSEASGSLASAAISADVTEYCRQDATDAEALADAVTRAVEQCRRDTRRRAELDEVLGRITDAFFALDDDWRFTHLNERAEELLDVAASDVWGENIWEAFPAATETAFYERYHRAMETQEPVSFVEYYPPLGGWFEVRAYPSETGLSVYFRDVTERKNREQELELYERVVETVGDGVYALNPEGQFVFVNEELAEMYGRDRDALLGEPAETVHSSEVADRASRLAAELIDTDDDWVSLYHLFRTADGDTFPAESRFGLLEYGTGEYGRVGVVRDISDRVEREQELEATAEVFHGLHDAVSDRDTDFETTMDRLFDLGCDYLGLEYGFLTHIENGRQIIEHASGDHPELQPGEQCPLERSYCRKTVDDGGRVALPDAVAADWTDDPAYREFGLDAYVGGTVVVAGEVYGTLCFASDEARDPFAETETALIDLLAQWVSFELERQALENERERLAFFNRLVRHDLLNDLNVVSARSKLLYDHVDPEPTDHLDLVVERTEEMIDLTETIRSLMTTVVSDPDLEPVDLGAVLREECQFVERAYDSLTVSSPDPPPEVEVWADELLGELFENLLQNAVDHDDSPETHVDVDIDVDEETVTVHVADDGPGMSDDRKARFFERGTSGEASTGTGVGLYLVDELLDVYGGDVDVRDNEPTGTVFSVTLRRV